MHAHQDSDGVIPEVSQSKSVPTPRAIWRAPEVVARHSQMGELLGILLDAAGPLSIVASQLLYAAGPFFGSGAIRLARLLESEEPVPDLTAHLPSGEARDPHNSGAASD